MNKYIELKNKHQAEINAFPMFFAFSDEQFTKGMKSLGLKETDTDKIYSLKGTGGFYKKTDAAKLNEMFERHETECNKAMEDAEYLFQMFYYELGNHEYCITYDLEDTLDALGLTLEQVNNDKRLLKALKAAKKKYLESIEV